MEWRKMNKQTIINKAVRALRRKNEKLGRVDMKDMGFFRKAFIVLWNNKFNLLIMAVAFAVIAALAVTVFHRDTAMVTLSLNYEEASKGQNPNSTRFNIYEFKSPEVVEAAIRSAGLEGVVDTDDMIENIDIEEAYSPTQLDISDESSYYISTSYRIKYVKNRHMKHIDAEQMLELICQAYNNYFHDAYVGSRTVLNYEPGDVANMEYIEIGKLMIRRTDQMIRYIQQRINENATFRSEQTGESFQTIQKMLQNVQDYSIKKYTAFAEENGLTKERDHYVRTLTYKNAMSNIKYREYMIDYNVRKTSVANYDEAMIGTVMIPSVNDNDDYYMSRTNIGTDYLTKQADEALSDSVWLQREMLGVDETVAKINASAASDDDYVRANEMINSVQSELVNVARIADATDKEYLKHTTKDYLTFAFVDDVSGKIALLRDILLATVIFMIFAAIMLYFVDTYIRSRGGGIEE